VDIIIDKGFAENHVAVKQNTFLKRASLLVFFSSIESSSEKKRKKEKAVQKRLILSGTYSLIFQSGHLE